MPRAAVTSAYAQWGRWSPHDLFDHDSTRMIAGGETAMLWLAFGLSAAGWEVSLFYDTDKPQTYRGVDFLPASYVPDLICNRHYDVLISWENLQPPSMNHTADLVVIPFQTNAMAVGALDYSLDYYQVVSQWHIETLIASDPSFRPEQRSKFVVIPNGVDLDRYRQPPPERHPFRIVHSSSPDRGLHHLLRMWPDIKKAVPEAELHIFYEVKRWLDLEASFPGISTGDRAREIRRLLAATEGQGVIVRGPVNQWQLAQEQMAASLLAYSCDTIDHATEGFCCLPDTPVMTATGIKTISNIAVGDSVVGHSGKWRPVTRVFERSYSGPVLEIGIPGWPETMALTPEHPVMTFARGGQTTWVPASQRPRWVGVKPPCDPLPSDFNLKLSDYDPMPNIRRGKSRRTVLPLSISVDTALCELLGWYLSEGTASNRGEIYFSLSGNETAVADRIQKLLHEIFGLTSCQYRPPTGNKLQVKACSVVVANLLRELGGHLARNKHLPRWAFGLSVDNRRALLGSLFCGDGCVSRHRHTLSCRLATTSFALAYGVRLLLLQERARVGGSYDCKRDAYEVSVNSRHVPWLARTMGYEVPDRSTTRFSQYQRRDGIIRLRARWDEREYAGTVHDLTVRYDHSFLAGPITVHNCITILEGLAAGTPVITTDEDAFKELWPDVTRQLPLPVENKEDSWVRAIHYLLTDKAEWQRYSDNGRRHAEQYDWEKIGRDYAAWLEGALRLKRGEKA